MLRALVVAALVASPAAADVCDERTHCFSVRLHVNEGATTSEFLDGQLARANELFASSSIGFRVVGTDDRAPARVMNTRERIAVRPQVTGAELHVFVTRELADVDNAGEQIRGVTIRKGATKYVILSAIAWDRVLAHELGHVFGLPHSTYDESIMNKAKRDRPMEERVFATAEVAIIKTTAARLVKEGVLTTR